MQVSRKNIMIVLFIITIIGLLFSRALLSISCGLWLIAGIRSLFNDAKPFSPNPLFIWGATPLSLCLLGLWQHPFEKANYDLLLSWAAYPAIAIGVIFIRTEDLIAVCKKIWIYGAAIAALYPILWLLFHFSDALALIKIGKAIPVFMDNDHLRFSIYIASALLLSYTLENNKIKRLLIFFFIAVLLLLSVRTGLVLALIIIIFSARAEKSSIWRKRKSGSPEVGKSESQRKSDNVTLSAAAESKCGSRSTVHGLPSISNLLFPISCCLILLLSLPFLSQKLNYTMYDYQQFTTKGYNPTYSDGLRRAVNYASIEAVKNNCIGGVGWGKVAPTVNEYFNIKYQQAPPFSWPFSQYIFWWLGAGIAGLLCFTAWLLFPIWWGYKTKQPAIVIWSIAIAVSCFVESNLNFQFGIVLHAWPLWLVTLSNDRIISKVE
jgi:hypothetical protein